MTTPQSFPELLAGLLGDGGSRPLVTAYDDATGERTELSVASYANWVAKTANLLVDELMLEPGETVLLDLPPHWLTTVFLGGAWAAGLAVAVRSHGQPVVGPDPAVHAVVCGPDDPAVHLGLGVPVVACSLDPFARPFSRALPEGVLDHGTLWPGQADVFEPVPAPGRGTVAWQPGASTQGELLARAADGAGPMRLLTDADPCLEEGVPAFLRPLVSGGSLVLVRRPDDSRWASHRASERATAELRRTPAPGRTPG